MANELIVDFPEQSHSHDMCPPNRDCNDQAVSRGSSPLKPSLTATVVVNEVIVMDSQK